MKRFVLLTGLFLMLAAVFSYAQETAPAAAAPEKAAPATGAPWSKTITPKTEDTLVVYVDPGNLLHFPYRQKSHCLYRSRNRTSESSEDSSHIKKPGSSFRLPREKKLETVYS